MTPRALAPFLRFAQVLRHAGFPVSPDQTIGFIQSVGLLGPRDMTDIHRAGRALFSIPPERRAEYDALFRAVFLDQTIAAPADTDDDSVEAYEPTGQSQDVEARDEQSEAGAEPTTAERLATRALTGAGDAEALARLERHADALPRRRSFRRRATPHGDRLHLRRILRDAARRDGEVMRLHTTRSTTRQRRVLLLIDVSGSMKDRSDPALRLAHRLVQSADRAEVFTLGTRLTRITAALRPADRALALARAGAAIADLDGGTRIGEALAAYLAVPRYAGFARGAAVVVLSDGLERGDPGAMVDAVTRLARLAWRIDWLTPLASDPAYRPETAALKQILPLIQTLGDGSDTAAIVTHLLHMGRVA